MSESDLEKRLYEILNKARREQKPDGRVLITEVMAAIKDAGYNKVGEVGTLYGVQVASINGDENIMTGAEWYARFEKEADSCIHYIRSLFRQGYPTATEADDREMFVKQDILEAAKRAAGIDER